MNQLRKWPADLFFAFLAACLIIGSVVFLIFVTVAICVPTVVGNRCPRKRLSYAKRNVLVERPRSSQNSSNRSIKRLSFRLEDISILEVGASSNAYFIKLDNQNWSTTDYCYIETAARKHPEFNVSKFQNSFLSVEREVYNSRIYIP